MTNDLRTLINFARKYSQLTDQEVNALDDLVANDGQLDKANARVALLKLMKATPRDSEIEGELMAVQYDMNH
jgi:hypothetical protein